MFAGTGGTGVENMPSPHSKTMPQKCITCHIYKGKSEKENEPLEKGGHTFRLDDRVCLKCHEKSKDLIAEWEAKISPMIKQLRDLLDSYPDKTSKIYVSANRNYALVVADGGMGIHNPRYAQALLKHSISSLSAELWK